MSEHTPDDTPDLEDFDAFWDTKNRKRPHVKIGGKVYDLPPSLPLQFELEARKLQRSKRNQDVTKLVSILFGQDVYDELAASGMDIEQFKALLAWAPRRISGQNVTLAEVVAELEAKEAEGDADPS